MVGQSCRFAHSRPAGTAMFVDGSKTTSMRSLFQDQGGAAAPPYLSSFICFLPAVCAVNRSCRSRHRPVAERGRRFTNCRMLNRNVASTTTQMKKKTILCDRFTPQVLAQIGCLKKVFHADPSAIGATQPPQRNWRQGCRQNPQAKMPALRSAGFLAAGSGSILAPRRLVALSSCGLHHSAPTA